MGELSGPSSRCSECGALDDDRVRLVIALENEAGDTLAAYTVLVRVDELQQGWSMQTGCCAGEPLRARLSVLGRTDG